MKFFMRQIILGAVLCVSLPFQTVIADTDAIATNSNKPFKEKYAAIDAEIDGLLESLQTEYRSNLDEAKKWHGERKAQLYENAPGVFERADQERALNKKYNARRRDLEQEHALAKKDIYALRTKARRQLSRNSAVEVAVWDSMQSFDTKSTIPGVAMDSPAGTSVGETGPGHASGVNESDIGALPPRLGQTNSATPEPGSGSAMGGGGQAAAVGSGPKVSAVESASDIPKFDEDKGSFGWSDGTTTTAIGPGGSTGKVSDKGDVVFGDGTTITRTGDQQVSVYSPDGTSEGFESDDNGVWNSTGTSYTSGVPDTNTTVDTPKTDEYDGAYSWSDGTTVSEIGPGGEAGKVNDKGDIVFESGATIVHTGEGEVMVHEPDGSSRTYRANEEGRWSAQDDNTGSDNGSDSGTGSDNGGRTGGKGKDSGNNGNDENDSSGSSDSDNDNDDDNDSDSDADTDAEADTKTETDSADVDADDDKGKGSSKESYGEGSGTYASGPNAIVQGIVDRATGNSTSPDSGIPEECSDTGSGGTISQPGMGSSGACIPAGLPGISSEENQPETPQASDAVISEDQRRAAGAGISDRVGQPGLQDPGILIGDLPSHTTLDQAPVINPEPQN